MFGPGSHSNQELAPSTGLFVEFVFCWVDWVDWLLIFTPLRLFAASEKEKEREGGAFLNEQIWMEINCS